MSYFLVEIWIMLFDFWFIWLKKNIDSNESHTKHNNFVGMANKIK
jgi:hypothetical protein